MFYAWIAESQKLTFALLPLGGSSASIDCVRQTLPIFTHRPLARSLALCPRCHRGRLILKVARALGRRLHRSAARPQCLPTHRVREGRRGRCRLQTTRSLARLRARLPPGARAPRPRSSASLPSAACCGERRERARPATRRRPRPLWCAFEQPHGRRLRACMHAQHWTVDTRRPLPLLRTWRFAKPASRAVPLQPRGRGLARAPRRK